MSLAKDIQKREQRLTRGMLGKSKGYAGSSSSPRLKRYQGVKVGGKRITHFSQIKTKPASKIGVGERTRRGIGIAIL